MKKKGKQKKKKKKKKKKRRKKRKKEKEKKRKKNKQTNKHQDLKTVGTVPGPNSRSGLGLLSHAIGSAKMTGHL